MEINEEKLINCISKSEEEILRENDMAIIEDFSEVKSNILNWYNFKKNSDILEVNTDLGGITELLSERAENVILTCENDKMTELLDKKYQNLNNIEIYSIDQLGEKKFDYIILYNLNDIEIVKRYLKENGIILLMVDNKFSISSFAGAKPKTGKIFETIMEDDEKTFSKKTIEKTLKENGFTTYKFYYPLPNYRTPNVIFSDEYMPNENTTKLMYNIIYRNGSAVVFDELKALKQLTKDGQFENFVNSYLVEINNTEKDQPKFISFNNTRKKKYRLMTKIYDEFVEKTACFKEAQGHIQNIEKNTINLQKLGFKVIDEKVGKNIKCRYVNTDTLDKIIAQKISNNQIEEAYTMIQEWYGHIKSKLLDGKPVELNENINPDNVEELNIIENGYIDMVLENIFLEDGEYVLFDQEWYIEGIPIEFILYRAINNLYVYNQEINKVVGYQELMDKFGLTKHLDIFKNIEKYIQSGIIDEQMEEVKKKSLDKLVDINSVALMKTQINDYEANDKLRDEYIKTLENEIKNVNEINRQQDEYIKSLEQQKNTENRFKRFLKGSK